LIALRLQFVAPGIGPDQLLSQGVESRQGICQPSRRTIRRTELEETSAPLSNSALSTWPLQPSCRKAAIPPARLGGRTPLRQRKSGAHP
jgi:hypothetical protein